MKCFNQMKTVNSILEPEQASEYLSSPLPLSTESHTPCQSTFTGFMMFMKLESGHFLTFYYPVIILTRGVSMAMLSVVRIPSFLVISEVLKGTTDLRVAY